MIGKNPDIIGKIAVEVHRAALNCLTSRNNLHKKATLNFWVAFSSIDAMF